MRIPLAIATFLSLLAVSANAQEQGAAARTDPRIDPEALKILKATTDVLKDANMFSFRANMRTQGTLADGQPLTLLQQSDVTVGRPNRLFARTTGGGQVTEVYFNRGDLFIYAPDQKLFVGLAATSNLDLAVDRLEEGSVPLPMATLLRSDPYTYLTNNLERAQVVGTEVIDGRPHRHLSFSGRDVDWQLWVPQADQPLPRRAELYYKTAPRPVRVEIDYSDWNPSANPSADLFVFQRPADAKAADLQDLDTDK